MIYLELVVFSQLRDISRQYKKINKTKQEDLKEKMRDLNWLANKSLIGGKFLVKPHYLMYHSTLIHYRKSPTS